MTEVLTKTIMEGQREKILDSVIEKILISDDYEEYIEDRIENVLSELVKTFNTKDKDDKNTNAPSAASNYFRDGVKNMIADMIGNGEIPFESRMKAMEQVLFKTSASDRNRLFDHIYEKIAKAEKSLLIEVDRIDKQMRRIEKRNEMINVQQEQVREQNMQIQK